MQTKKKFKRGEIICNKIKDGFVAEYRDLSDHHETQIKKTTNKRSPFIGILKYKELKYMNQAPTQDQAMAGPFKAVSEQSVTELFIYMNNRWHR